MSDLTCPGCGDRITLSQGKLVHDGNGSSYCDPDGSFDEHGSAPEDQPSALHCCLCLHTRNEVALEADTVINGQAVCHDHMGYVQGGLFSSALVWARKSEAQP